jgi:CRP-like cAMP-binding protein
MSIDEQQKQAILSKLHDLKGLKIFSQMNEREIFEVMKRSDILSYEADQLIFNEGDQEEYLYVIIKGLFNVTSTTRSGDDLTFFVAGTGLIFGEMSFMDRQPRSATITAGEPSEVFRLTRDDFDDLLAKDPTTAAKFMFGVAEILSRRMRGANQRIKYAT